MLTMTQYNRNHNLNYRNPKQPPFKIIINSNLKNSFLWKLQRILELLARGRKRHNLGTETRLRSWSLPSTMSSRLTAGFRKLPLSKPAANPGLCQSMRNWKIWGSRKLNNGFTITSNLTNIDHSSKKEPKTQHQIQTLILRNSIGLQNFSMKLRLNSLDKRQMKIIENPEKRSNEYKESFYEIYPNIILADEILFFKISMLKIVLGLLVLMLK